MIKPLTIVTGILLIFVCFPGSGQTKVKISNPRLELKDSILIVSYDILNSRPDSKYRVWIEATDRDGRIIPARSISGESGEGIIGGPDKTIIWNIRNDSISDSTGLYIQVMAMKIKPLPPGVTLSDISITGSALKSIVFPGWGLSAITVKKPHWIKGIAGYGCITASVIYNRKAASSYNNYIASMEIDESESWYKRAEKEERISKTFAYTAAGIWVADFIWTVSSVSRLKKGAGSGRTGFNVKPSYDLIIHTPLIAFTYTF